MYESLTSQKFRLEIQFSKKFCIEANSLYFYKQSILLSSNYDVSVSEQHCQMTKHHSFLLQKFSSVSPLSFIDLIPLIDAVSCLPYFLFFVGIHVITFFSSLSSPISFFDALYNFVSFTPICSFIVIVPQEIDVHRP